MPHLKPQRRTVRLLAAAVLSVSALTLSLSPLRAKHPTNAGPENVEIKFKVPTEPAYSPAEALKKFKLDDRFEIQLVASEPMVQDPIAISFDDQARMYVVEYRGYMHDVEGKGEDQPVGRIKLLIDSDSDGVMDTATVFADQLVMPRAVMAVAGGALVAEPPYLTHYRDTDNDGVADEKTLLAEDFGRKGGQPEHMANTPLWGLDNWIYCGAYTKRFRFEKGKWISTPTRSRGQWGLTQDDVGRLFYNYNSDLLRADLLPAHYLSRNPSFTPADGANYKVLTDQTIWPGRPTPGVNRGYQDGALRPDGTLKSATAACGPGVYRADLFPPDFHGNVFIPEPSVNLLKRVTLSDTNGLLSAKNPTPGAEFLTSTDERFRPVNALTGPDGALYVVDLYRGVLQHKAFLTHYLIKNIQERQLETPINLGRIYRIVPKGTKPTPTKLPTDTVKLVDMLAHPNGWVRDTAQRLLVERRDAKAVGGLKKLIQAGPTPLARLHALWTLEGMGKLEQDVTLAALKDADSKVRVAAVRLSEPFLVPATAPDVLPPLIELARSDASFDVQLQLALTLSGLPMPDAEQQVLAMLAKHGDHPLMREAIVSGLRGRELETLERLFDAKHFTLTTKHADLVNNLAQCVMNERRSARVARLFTLLESRRGDANGSANDALSRAILEGMAGGKVAARARTARPTRLVYLDEPPTVLASLLNDPKTKDLATKVDARVAWPGKPGVPPPPVVRPLTSPEQALFEKGKTVYANTCAACHQPTGVGQDGLAPPLVDSEWVLGPAERLPRIVLHGLAGPITVNGIGFNLEMPALATLTDEEIAAVLTYIRREWEHGADPVPVELVQRIRTQYGDSQGMWSAQELAKIK